MLKTKDHIKIGGEFEINPKDLNGIWDFHPESDSFLFSSGRSALKAILEFISRVKPKIIYIPYYICPSVVSTCMQAGYTIKFYELDNDFLFPIDDLEKINKNATLLTVNYFGFVDDNNIIKKIKKDRPDITIISDQVQSFWTYKNTCADFSFTSLRKHFATPDGALVFSKNGNWRPDKQIETNNFYWPKLMASLLKFQKDNDEIYLKLFEEGEKLLDAESKITQGSKYAKYFFTNANLDLIRKRRLRNTKRVYELGNKIGLNFVFRYNEKTVPLSVPVFIKNRDEVRKKLFNKNIFLPVHWPINQFNEKSKISKKLAKNSISLVIDQRYNLNHMEYQLNNFKKIILK